MLEKPPTQSIRGGSSPDKDSWILEGSGYVSHQAELLYSARMWVGALSKLRLISLFYEYIVHFNHVLLYNRKSHGS